MNRPICQSCAMLMGPDDFGTEKGGVKSNDYCKYCYADGAFTYEQTLEEMIETCVTHMATPESGFTPEQARAMLQKELPNLKRWKKEV